MELAIDEGFIVTLSEKAEATDVRSRAAAIDWLANEATHILLRAGRHNDWGATCFTCPCMHQGDPSLYKITMFFM